MNETTSDPRVEDIRAVIAERSVELGPAVRPGEVDVELASDEVAPGCRLFRATWGGARDSRSLAGVLRDDDRPDAYPGQALGKVLRRWVDAEGSLPDAARVASAAAFLLDSDERHTVILAADQSAGEPGAETPVLVLEPDRLGVSFSWTTGRALSIVTATIDDSDRLTVVEKAQPETDLRTP